MVSLLKVISSKPVASWSLVRPHEARITLSGRISADSLGTIWQQIRDQQDQWLASHQESQILVIDGSQIDYLDGAGLAFLIDLSHAQEITGSRIRLEGFSPSQHIQLKRFAPFAKMFPSTDTGSADNFIVKQEKQPVFFGLISRALFSLQGRLPVNLSGLLVIH